MNDTKSKDNTPEDLDTYTPEEALDALNWIMNYDESSSDDNPLGQNTQCDYKLLNTCVESLQKQISATEKPQPIMYFNTDEELQACLQEWQERLFLQHWNIQGSLVSGEAIPEMAGDSTVQWVNSCGTIRIREEKDMPVNTIEKDPHEKILVHELLHFKYMGFEGVDTIEGTYFDEKQHQLLEQMAKSLIMAKYNIRYDWFKL